MCKIQAMPTFQFYKSGKKLGEVVGGDLDQIEKIIKQNIGTIESEGKSLGGGSTQLAGQKYVNPYKDEKKEKKR